MGKMLHKTVGSIRFWILVAVSVYLVYGIYFSIYGLGFTWELATSRYVYDLVSKNSLWWAVLYYGSEGAAGTIAILLRPIAGAFAVYAAYMFWRQKEGDSLRKNVCRALALEAGFFLMLIPSVATAFAYNLTSEYLFYFEHTPPLILLYGTAIPCLTITLIVPPLLLKLHATIKHEAAKETILKWASLTGISYILVVFWFNYSMLWAANMVTYPRPGQLYGLGFLLQPAVFVSFAVTVFGLLAVGIAAFVTLRPAVKKQPAKVNLTRLGAVMTAFGSYFIFNTLYYFLTGGYEAHPSVWFEVIGPLHNPNLWAIALILVGVPLMIRGRLKSEGLMQNGG